MGSPKLVAILGAALVAALLVIAFLLGQRSAPAGLEPRVQPSPAAWHAAPSEPSGSDPEPGASARSPTPPDGPRPAESPRPAPAPSPPIEVAAPRSAPPAGDGDSEVAAYLAAVQGLQVGPAGGDPQAFAQQLLGETMNGNLSGFDGLVREAEASRRRAAALVPPPAAAEHHRRLLALLTESVEVLQAERQALSTQDPSALTALLGRAQALEQKARALEASEAALRNGAGGP